MKENIKTEALWKYYVFSDERFVDLNLFQFGREKCAPLHQFGPAKRNHFLFHYIISGEGKLETSDQTFFLHENQGFILFPDQISTYFASETNPWTYIWLEFDGMRIREILREAGLSESSPVYTPLSVDAGALVLDEMSYILNHHEANPLNLIGHGMIFLDHLVEGSDNKNKTSTRKLRDFYLKEAVGYIEANYQSDITIEQISDACGLNRSYFGRLFKDTMGESPQSFLMHYRLTKAAENLKKSSKSIGDISTSVGYANQLHFSRAFKSYYGISPRDYRNKYLII